MRVIQKKTFHAGLILFLSVLILPSCEPDDKGDNSIQGKVVKSIFIDATGTKWFATDKGVSSFDGENWTHYNEKDGLPAPPFNDLASSFVPNRVALWMASTKGAVYTHLIGGNLEIQDTYTTVNSDLLSDTVHAIAADNAGYVWIGTEKGLVGLKDYSEWIIQQKAVFSLPITRISSSPDGWNYFATLGGGIARNKTSVDGVTSASTYEAPWAGVPSDNIYAMYVDTATGNQWYGTAAGAAYHVGTETKKNWSVFTTLNGLVNDYVLTIAGDASGNIWFGTKGGVSRFGQSTWTSFTEADGLANNTVYAIAFDRDGSVWFGTEDGVSHYNGTWVTYRE